MNLKVKWISAKTYEPEAIPLMAFECFKEGTGGGGRCIDFQHLVNMKNT